jgi:glycerol uptake facilitator-like aquaporin
MVVGLLVGGAAGLAAGLWVASSRPGAESAVLVAGGLLAAIGLVLGATTGAAVTLGRYLGRRPGRADGPEADYRDPDPPGT